MGTKQSIQTAISIATGQQREWEERRRVGALTVSTKLLWQMKGHVPFGISLIDRLNQCPAYSSRASFPLSLGSVEEQAEHPRLRRERTHVRAPPSKHRRSLPRSYTHKISALTVTGFLPATAVAANVFDLLAYVILYHKRDVVSGAGGLLQWLHPH